MASLACVPSLTTTWQRPQIPRPPQTESRSTPSVRAASRTLVPAANAPRLPEGVKTARTSEGRLTGAPPWGAPDPPRFTGAPPWGSPDPSGSRLLRRRTAAALPTAPSAAGRPVSRDGRRATLAVATDPGHAVAVVAEQHVRRGDRPPDVLAEHVGVRAAQPPGHGHCHERRRVPLPARQAERDVGGAAGGVDAGLLPEPPHQAEHLSPGGGHRADRHHQRVDHDVGVRDAVVGGTFD